jgi:hypothetical protein
MPVSREEVDAWFAANPDAKPEDVAAAVKSIGGLDANTGLSDILADRYKIGADEVQGYYNNFASPTGALAQANSVNNSGLANTTQTVGTVGNTVSTTGALDRVNTAATAATETNYNPYLTANKDVAAAYTSSNQALTPGQFAAMHYQNFGASEGRAAPTGFDKYNIVKGNTDVSVTPVYDYFTEGVGDSQTQNSRIIGYTDQNGNPVDPSTVRTDVALDGTVDYLAPLGIGLGETSYIDKATGKTVSARDYRIATDQASDIDKLTAQILGQGTSDKWQGSGFGSAEANAEDMARILLTAGITDINDFGKFPQYDASGKQIAEVYGNKKTGEIIDIDYVQADTAKNIWSGTYAGDDSTSYGVQFDAAGNPIFYTQPGESSSDLKNIQPILAIASIIPSPLQPFAMAANAMVNLSQGNVLGAVLSAAGAYGASIGSDISALQAAEASGDIINASQLLDLQNTAAAIKLGTTAVGGLNAAANGDWVGVLNAGMSGATQLGVALPSGLTTGVQVGNLVNSLSNNDIAGALGVIGDFVQSPDLKTAAAATKLFQVLSNDNVNPADVANAAQGLFGAVSVGSKKSPGDVTVEDRDTTSLGSNAYIAAINAGANEEEALAAANAVTGSTGATTTTGGTRSIGTTGGATTDANGVVVNKTPDSVNNSVITTPVDDGEGDLAGAQADATKRNTVTIGNAEADNPDEAAYLAKLRDPTASSFTYGGKTYTMSASNDQVRSIAIQNDIASAPTFNDAYRIAREQLGANKTFTYNGKEYSTATATERPDLTGKTTTPPVGEATDQSAAETARLAGQNASLVSGNAPSQSAAETTRLNNLNAGLVAGATKEKTDAAKAAINSVLGDGLASDLVTQGLSNIHQAVGQTISFFGGTGSALGLTGPNNALTQAGDAATKAGEELQLESINQANSNVIGAVQKAEGFIPKVVAGAKAIIENPLSANMAAIEILQEALPIGVAAKVYGLAGKYAAVGVDVALNAIESGGAAYNDRYNADIKAGATPSQAESNATKSFWIASAVTAVTGGVTDMALVNKITKTLDDAAAKAVTKPVSAGAVSGVKEAGSEGAEVFATGVLTALALGEKPDINKILTQSIVEGYVGGKTSGSLDASSSAINVVSGDVKTSTGSTDLGAVGATKPGAESVTGNDLGEIGKVTPGRDVATNGADLSDKANVNISVADAQQTMGDLGLNVSDDVAVSLATKIQDAKNSGNDVSVTSDENIVTINDVTANTKTTVDANTNTTTTLDSNTNTTTQTNVNPNTNIATQVAVNANTNIQTTVVTNPNTNIQTTVVTNPNTNTQTTVKVNIETGDVIDEQETVIPDDWKPAVIEVPVIPSDKTPPGTTTTTKPTTPAKVNAGAGMAAGLTLGGGATGLPSTFDIDPAMLASRVTQGKIDPLARVKEIQAELERESMMNQIDPRLMSVMQQRMDPNQQSNQLEQDTGALAKILRGESPDPSASSASANEGQYYSYGAEDSIDDILGGKAANYKAGGFVEPLKASGGMVLPLLAKSGGALGHYSGREDFKGGKHVAGEGDGQSDDIPAWLADGEFVFPADVVSALGNGSTKAGTDKLYEMMHGIRDRARSKGPKDLPPPALKSALDYLKSSKRSSK